MALLLKRLRKSWAQTNPDHVGCGKVLFSNGDQIPIFDTHDVWVEGEFGLWLGSELPTRDQAYSRSEVISAIDGAAAALELVGSRFRSGIANSGRYNVTADCGANIALCIGEIATLSKLVP